MQKTDIQYLTHTLNPIAMKCTRVTEGCKNCWHLAMANRLANNPNIDAERRAAYAGGCLVLIGKELDAPGKIKKPSRIGLQFMGDLFHKNIETEWIAEICRKVVRYKQHKFILLSKRPERMEDFFRNRIRINMIPNLWLGVSISTNDDLWMVDKLLEIPAAVRFVSVEPMLEHIDIENHAYNLDWVICGAETGPGKRPFDIGWAHDMQEQCFMMNVPFFFKQDGDGNNTIDGKTYQEYPHEKT